MIASDVVIRAGATMVAGTAVPTTAVGGGAGEVAVVTSATRSSVSAARRGPGTTTS
jgi:hypothetical protein